MKPHNNEAIHKGRWTLHLYRIAIAPWSTTGLNLRELELLEMRARNMGVNVSTHRRGQTMIVGVRGDAGAVELKGEGDLLAIIAGALSDYETAYSGEAWTPEELVVVASQSGIPVERG